MTARVALRIFRRWTSGKPPILFGRHVPDLPNDVRPDALVTLVVQVPTELGGRSVVVGHLPIRVASAIALALEARGFMSQCRGEGFVISVSQLVKVRARQARRRRSTIHIVKEERHGR